MVDLLNELKSREDRRIRAQLEQKDIQKALKEIERDKASALQRDKRRELERIAAERETLRLREESCMDEIRNYEEKVYESEKRLQEHRNKLQNKVDSSEYIQTVRKKEIELAKHRGEELARLKHKKEQLEIDRERIMGDLELAKNGDPSVLRKNEASRWVANDIISSGKMDFKNIKISEEMKDNLVSIQAKINMHKEAKAKIEKEAFPMIDELDVLQKQYGGPSFNKEARYVAEDIDNRHTKPEVKAEQMQLMRKHLERNGGPENFGQEGNTNDLQNKVNGLQQEYQNSKEFDPVVANGMAELQNAIKNVESRGGPVAAPVVGISPIVPPVPGVLPGGLGGPTPFPVGGVPPLPGGPFGPLGGVPPLHGGPFGPMGNPMAHPLGPGADPNLNYMQAEISKQEEINKKLDEEVSSKSNNLIFS